MYVILRGLGVRELATCCWMPYRTVYGMLPAVRERERDVAVESVVWEKAIESVWYGAVATVYRWTCLLVHHQVTYRSFFIISAVSDCAQTKHRTVEFAKNARGKIRRCEETKRVQEETFFDCMQKNNGTNLITWTRCEGYIRHYFPREGVLLKSGNPHVLLCILDL